MSVIGGLNLVIPAWDGDVGWAVWFGLVPSTAVVLWQEKMKSQLYAVLLPALEKHTQARLLMESC